jgi:hypothetical protein
MRPASPFVLALLAAAPLPARTVLAQPTAPPDARATAELEVASYTMDVRLEPSHRALEGMATVRWVNSSARPVTELWWHLYMNGFASARSLFMRSGGAEGHRGHAPGAPGGLRVRSLRLDSGEDLLTGATHDPAVPDDTTQLRTPLPRPVPPGGALTITVAFRTEFPAAFARTGYWRDFVFAGQWFPKLAVLEHDGRWAHFPFHAQAEFYADFGTYDVTLTVPRGDVVGATGVEVGPVVYEGPRERHRFVAARVHDFAWTAWAGFRERLATVGSTRVRVLHPPGLESVAARNLTALERALPIFARRFGPFPYPQLTVVIPPPGAAGVEGMEYPTLITSGGVWPSLTAVRDAEYVTLHEFAHQYFYGLLASDEWTWPFLDEGFAEYATGVAMGELYGPGRELASLDGLRLGFWAFQGSFSGTIDRQLPVSSRAVDFPGFAAYGNHVYRRTATILRTAELTFGAEAVERALRDYALRWRFRHPTPEAVLETFADVMGTPFVDEFLRPAFFGDATVDFAVVRIEPGPTTRVVLTRQGALVLPVEVSLEFVDGRRRLERWDGRGSTHTLEVSGPAVLRAVRVDPSGRVPLDRNRLDNARAVPGAEGSVLPLSTRLAGWLGALLRLVGP